MAGFINISNQSIMYTIEFFRTIKIGRIEYGVGQYDVTKDDLLEITGETSDEFNGNYCDENGVLSKYIFNSSHVDIHIL